VFFNVNAADDEKRAHVINTIRDTAGPNAPVRLLLHTLAFGSLRPYVTLEDPNGAVTRQQMEMTLDVMAHSLVYWTQDLVHNGLMAGGATIWAMTSAGDLRAISTYGPVSAAKACLDAHVRQLALELAPLGIRVNAIRAGVTDTPALRRIPVHEQLIEQAMRRNPSGRMTTPQDVAAAISVLAQSGATWMTGNIINVDGGEEIAG
jgi:enoyl-[acyl-carrier-protein] reductase (NADH)